MSQMRGLGKGIRALIPESGLDLKKEEVTRIPLKAIRPSGFQPRQNLDNLKIQELANSIQESGLIYPLLVRKTQDSGVDGPVYELIAGERRFRALERLGYPEAQVIVKEVSDRKALELSLLENLQREDLNPIEQALAYQRLMTQFELTQEAIAQATGKNRATIANTLRLLKLPSLIRQEIGLGKITLGHAKALLSLGSERTQKMLAEKIVAQDLSVRQTEGWVRKQTLGIRATAHRARDPHLAAAEERLRRALGTSVKIDSGRSRGWIRIAFFSLKDLNRLLNRLAG